MNIMEYRTSNNYKVFFKDGTHFESSGSANRINKSPISNEFEWVSFHIKKEVRLAGKTLADISKIEYTLNYNK